MKVATILATPSDANFLLALNQHLNDTRQLSGFEGKRLSNAFVGTAQKSVTLHAAGLGPLDGISVKLPVDVSVTLSPQGTVAQVDAGSPSTELVQDAVTFAESLMANGQISVAGSLSPAITHVVETASDGSKHLTRRRFSWANPHTHTHNDDHTQNERESTL
jgi:hypothetical protein